jgi:hypothetical protein
LKRLAFCSAGPDRGARAVVPPSPRIRQVRLFALDGQRSASAASQRRNRHDHITGGETDVCVLATMFGAIDWGLRVIVVTDAACSSADETRDATMALYTNALVRRLKPSRRIRYLKAGKGSCVPAERHERRVLHHARDYRGHRGGGRAAGAALLKRPPWAD